MSKRKTPSSSGGGDDIYQVGYGKPPLHSRFALGRSGNPAGRPKSLRNLKTDVKRTLSAPTKLKEGGRQRTRSTQEVVLLVLREKALHGDSRALDLLLKLAQQFNGDEAEAASAEPLSADERSVLDAYVAECLRALDSGHDRTSGVTAKTDANSESP